MLKKFFVIAVAGIAFFACNKDKKFNTTQDGKLMGTTEATSYPPMAPLIVNPYPIEAYLPNPEDIDDENIDRQLYAIGLAARHLFKNTNLNSFIIETANQVVNDCVDLRTFMEWTLAGTGCPANKISELQNVLAGTNLQYISKNPMVYGEVEQYIPAIYVFNVQKANPNKMPIFSPGIFVNEDLPGMEQYEDHLVVWYFDVERNIFIEGLLSEEAALTLTNPIFIVDNANPKLSKTHKSGEDDEPEDCISTAPTPTQAMKDAYYKSYEYQLNYRMEATGKSEFCIDAALIDEHGGGGHRVTYKEGSVYPDWLIAKVAKKDIGKPLTQWFGFCLTLFGLDNVPFECNSLFWNLYERDWAKSSKPLGKGTANNKTIYLAGAMKYDNNWIAYNPNNNEYPNEVNDNPFDFAYVFNNGSKTYQNYMYKLTVYRMGAGSTPVKKGTRR